MRYAAARSHVNRLCLAAAVPLIESGSAGYQGQVTVIRKVKWSDRSVSAVGRYCVLCVCLPSKDSF